MYFPHVWLYPGWNLSNSPEMNDETYTNDLETKEIMRESLTEYELQ